jgi:hypothetical protein
MSGTISPTPEADTPHTSFPPQCSRDFDNAAAPCPHSAAPARLGARCPVER